MYGSSQGALYLPSEKTDLITQAELHRYLDLRAAIREATLDCDRIREKVHCGCRVESGDLAVETKVVQLRSFSFAKLVPIIGREEAEQLRNQIAPTEQLFIRVVDLTTGKTAKGSGHITLESLQQLP